MAWDGTKVEPLCQEATLSMVHFCSFAHSVLGYEMWDEAGFTAGLSNVPQPLDLSRSLSLQLLQMQYHADPCCCRT